MPWRGLADSTSLLSAAYEKIVLDAATQGEVVVTWVELTASVPGHTASFLVTADAAKIDDVRINVSATLQQQVADALGALLLTPRLLDLMWQEKAVTLLPSPQPIAATVSSMLAHSSRIDAAIAKAGGAPAGGIVQTVGKQWVLSNALLAHQGRAENYGWHFPGATFGGSKFEASVSLPGVRVIQGPGWAHDPSHVDYSQTCCLVHRACVVDGNKADLATVLQDKTLAPLASSDGALQVLRQPGVPLFACKAPGFTSSTLCPMPSEPAVTTRRQLWPWLAAGAIAAAGLGTAWWLTRKRRRR